ncbi:putative 26S proteasome regulatory subunit rpn7 [Neolecta irregularis DAH-3]|uniref:Putative 26S proteasome regulatory subunit rpn7 n=1 Tax=Neolecta irregularis (strain DAH-3) TaxID=1198029 RepID=A0A1U7LQ04_NEOID|nr:putative 26S proteasome regulatory subunit rpn7 [Neolecta irregularis DAH-3]|eukprot:OLL24724.1 putative 26S proteasome regulatory subunit rpn7 [Neolecta irregularis DAH-3]
MSENQIPHIPDLELAQQLFVLSSPPLSETHDTVRKSVVERIRAEALAPLWLEYKHLLSFDQSEYESLKKINDEKIQELDAKIKEAEESFGEAEVANAEKEKAEYLAKIGEKDKAVEAYKHTATKSPGLGSKIDLIFSQIRIGLFFSDHQMVKSGIDDAKILIDKGGDWERRNRLKAYNGIYFLSIRDFSAASSLLLDVLSTFTSTELLSYDEIVKYAVIAGVVSLSRVDMKTKLIDSPEVLQVLPVQYSPLDTLINSLYLCDYARFFKSLAEIEGLYIKTSRYVAPHTRYFIKEMRKRAYAQLLESYRALSIESMARAFGVSVEFLDAYVVSRILSNNLSSDLSIIETNRPDNKNAQYQAVVKQGDLLLNKLQKYQAAVRISGMEKVVA